ncbi:sensor histidine kinase [Virgibacillus phasianinus]|uniref:histidine kinase n=1 Tax=Virgibacillus phasianinus TaxID=2017483 RepID=A0A220TZ29_9BACI|nr:sensor histidine kinase [Virgibacillus phasianinus]ASK61005.1 sensor histidine kinase [Virgibacillus phasianinus]
MWNLLLLMLERIGIIVTVAFLMTRVRYFRTVIHQRDVTDRQRLPVMIMFGLFGILGTYTGLVVSTNSLGLSSWAMGLDENEAIANSRVIGIVIAGLIGGWKIGFGAGLIAGIHRYMLGGFTAFSCSISGILAGLLAGLVHKRLQKSRRYVPPVVALIVGGLAEALQMGLILLISRPFDQAYQLVAEIGLPMIVANGIGTAIFVLVISSVFHEEEKMGAIQAQKALRLAEMTIGHLRQGLSTKTAEATCNILLKEVQASAVAITNQQVILAHVGVASDHHQPNQQIQTEGTQHVLHEGKLLIADKDAINCHYQDCPLDQAVIAPLKRKSETVGTLKFYFQNEKDISTVTIEFIKGLSSLLSQQLEIADADRYFQLMKEAEIKALQAQVSPHFLFNALNTIVSLVRIDPDKARKLLISLSRYFRKNLESSTHPMTTLSQEFEHVNAYLSIEKERFIEKMEVFYEVEDEKVMGHKIPTMTLQPLVENALKHGMKGLTMKGTITISVQKQGPGVLVTVKDNGKGIRKERMNELLHKPISSETGTGIGLYNVNRRLEMMFGKGSMLDIRSSEGKGTAVRFYLSSESKGGRNDVQ